jgi:rod shape-determining protein MreC
MSWLRRNRFRLLVAGILGFSLLLFVAHMKEQRRRNLLDRALVWVTSPIENAAVWCIEGVGGLWHDYIYLVGLREENDLLKKKLADEIGKNAQLAELRAENDRLRELLDMRHSLGSVSVVTAKVIGAGTSPVQRTIRIAAGSSVGIKVGNVVVANGGLVGRVWVVTGDYAGVRLIVDGSSAVDVIDQRSRTRGIVRGQGEDEECSIDYLVRTADVATGDRIVTSGIGGVFSAGLLVGTVSRVTSPNVGVFREASLAPAVEFVKLEEVMVIVSPSSAGEGED